MPQTGIQMVPPPWRGGSNILFEDLYFTRAVLTRDGRVYVHELELKNNKGYLEALDRVGIKNAQILFQSPLATEKYKEWT